VTAEDFRSLALDLDGTVEKAHMGHPDFRVRDRIFATLQADDEWGAVRLAPEEQRELMRILPKAFTPAAGVWGERGWTKVKLAAADVATVRGALLLAWQAPADEPHTGPRTSAPSAKSSRPSRKRR
jgi:hypothetical protein